MTQFVLSHNPQISTQVLPILDASELASGLAEQGLKVFTVQALQHPHWKVRVDSDLAPEELANVVLQAWRNYRQSGGLRSDFTIIALGGRKDGATTPNSLLKTGAWGVDVVETADKSAFLKAINWEMLKASRDSNNVFEVYL